MCRAPRSRGRAWRWRHRGCRSEAVCHTASAAVWHNSHGDSTGLWFRAILRCVSTWCTTVCAGNHMRECGRCPGCRGARGSNIRRCWEQIRVPGTGAFLFFLPARVGLATSHTAVCRADQACRAGARRVARLRHDCRCVEGVHRACVSLGCLASMSGVGPNVARVVACAVGAWASGGGGTQPSAWAQHVSFLPSGCVAQVAAVVKAAFVADNGVGIEHGQCCHCLRRAAALR